MSGDCRITLKIGRNYLEGDNLAVCKDIFNEIRNTHGETMEGLLNSYISSVNAISQLEDSSIIDTLVGLRRGAFNEVIRKNLPGEDGGPNIGGQVLKGREFDWRKLNYEEGSALDNYLKAVDQLASEIRGKNPGDPMPHLEVDIGTYVQRTGRGKGGSGVNRIFVQDIFDGNYHPDYTLQETNGQTRAVDPAAADNPFMRDPDLLSRVNNRKERDEYLINIPACVPAEVAEEFFKTSLGNDSTYMQAHENGSYDRNNFDHFIAILGKIDPRTGGPLMTTNDEGEEVPVTRMIIQSYSPHRSDAADISDMVNDDNAFLIALQNALNARAAVMADKSKQEDVANNLLKDTKSALMTVAQKHGYGDMFGRLSMSQKIDSINIPEYQLDKNGRINEDPIQVRGTITISPQKDMELD